MKPTFLIYFALFLSTICYSAFAQQLTTTYSDSRISKEYDKITIDITGNFENKILKDGDITINISCLKTRYMLYHFSLEGKYSNGDFDGKLTLPNKIKYKCNGLIVNSNDGIQQPSKKVKLQWKIDLKCTEICDVFKESENISLINPYIISYNSDDASKGINFQRNISLTSSGTSIIKSYNLDQIREWLYSFSCSASEDVCINYENGNNLFCRIKWDYSSGWDLSNNGKLIWYNGDEFSGKYQLNYDNNTIMPLEGKFKYIDGRVEDNVLNAFSYNDEKLPFLATFEVAPSDYPQYIIKKHTAERRKEITENDKNGWVYVGSFKKRRSNFLNVLALNFDFESKTKYPILLELTVDNGQLNKEYVYIDENSFDSFKDCINQVRTKFIEWSELAKKNNIKSFEKIIPVNFHNTVWYLNTMYGRKQVVFYPKFIVDAQGVISLEFYYVNNFSNEEINATSELFAKCIKDEMSENADIPPYPLRNSALGNYFEQSFAEALRKKLKDGRSCWSFANIEEFDLLFDLLDNKLILNRVSEVMSVINAEKAKENETNAMFR